MENNNKKVVLIGGSNGIGLAIGKKLLDCGYTLEICDCLPPEEGVLDMEKVKYHHSDHWILMKNYTQILRTTKTLKF